MTAGAVQALTDRILGGDVGAAARLMRALDDGAPHAIEALRRLYPHTGRALTIGLTGTPGAGKSTVADELVAHLRKRGDRVGVVAVDPSSPYSGGAILGDRVRMQRHALDDGVFIRSVATRGAMGGLSRSTADIVDVLDAMGFAVVLIETVGVGQDEIDVARLADITVVLTVPGLGDEVQALKAGILEAADVLVVNKADREGADRTVRDLTTMLQLRGDGRGGVPIVKTTAARGEGIDTLLTAIETHRASAETSGAFAARRRATAQTRVKTLLADRIRRTVEATVAARVAMAGGLEALAAEVAERRTDPYTVAETLTGAPPQP